MFSTTRLSCKKGCDFFAYRYVFEDELVVDLLDDAEYNPVLVFDQRLFGPCILVDTSAP